MPSFIVRRIASTPDGSQMGAAQVMVHAADVNTAKQEGADQLGCQPGQVTAEPYNDPFWSHLTD